MAVSTIFQKINVTYHAPEGDSKVVEMLNTTFFDGTPVDVIGTHDVYVQLENNPHFQINSSTPFDPGDKAAPKHADATKHADAAKHTDAPPITPAAKK